MTARPATPSPRIAREKRTIQALLAIFCRAHHGRSLGLCSACQELADYALRRLDCCHFGEEKPTCAACPIHCYKPRMRERVQDAMRYAGPRMLLYHPILAIRHKLDAMRTRPTPRPNPADHSARRTSIEDNHHG